MPPLPPTSSAAAVAARPGIGAAAAWLLGLAMALLLWPDAAQAHVQWPDVGWLQARQSDLLGWQSAQPLLFGAAFFALFTLLSALALPGCALLCLAAGMCFGWLPGTLMVVLASTVGATLSFLAARHLWRDRVQSRWGHRLQGLHDGLARQGGYYLFALRMVPVLPFPLLNPLMGLTAMSLLQFFVVSLAGMLAGSALYVYAGVQLSMASDWQDLLSVPVLLSLALIGLLPWALLQFRQRWGAQG